MKKLLAAGLILSSLTVCHLCALAATDNVFVQTYDNYSVTEQDWVSGPAKVKPVITTDGDNNYMEYISNGKTHGAYEKIPEIDCTDAKIEIDADLRFAPTGTAGNSQFSICDSTPEFDSGNIDYGYSTSDPVSDGHIIAFEYNEGKTFKVNQTEISDVFIGDWFHMKAIVDFSIKKADIILTDKNGNTEEINDADFYSDNNISSIGAYYVRAAKPNGTVSVDNLTISDNMWDEETQPEVIQLSDEDNSALDSLTAGHSYTIESITAEYSDGTSYETSDFGITSSDDSIISISENTITANTAGTVTITFSYMGRTITKELDIKSFIPNIRPDRVAFMTNTGQQTKINVDTDENTDYITFSSSDDNVASVDENGIVTAVGKGDAVITITAFNEGTGDKCEKTCLVSVDYNGQNPIIPPSWNLFMADGEVYEIDGVAYMYGSHDYANGYDKDGIQGWCTQDYHVIYSTDLINWTDAGVVLTIDDIPGYSSEDGYRLWAPDMFKGADGKYYLVSCTEWDIRKFYISESTSPTGPFTNTRRIEVPGSSSGITGIDPAVLVDDDGTVYMATSNKDLYILDPEKGYAQAYSRITIPLFDSFSDTLKYIEGPSLKKRGDTYYYIFIASPISGKSTPMYMEYLYTKDITDPDSWEYGGTVVQSYGFLDAANIHGSIFEFNGEWYVSYHRLVPGFSSYTRTESIDKVEFDDEGKIIEVKRTSSGAKGAFRLGEKVQAASAVDFSGGMGDNRFIARGEYISDYEYKITDYAYAYFDKQGQYIGYRYVDMDSGADSVTVSVKTTGTGGVLAVKNAPDGQLIAEIPLPDTNDEWLEITQDTENGITGKQEIYFELETSPDSGNVAFDWFIFSKNEEDIKKCDIDLTMDKNEITSSLKNNTDTDKTCDVITAFYNNGILEDVKISRNTELKSGADTEITNKTDSSFNEIKIFIWDSIESMNPSFGDTVFDYMI